MNRGRVLSAVALVLAVAALGTVAGGLSTGETGSSDTSPGVGIGAGEGSGVGNGSGLGFNLSVGTGLGGPPWLGKGIILAIVWGAAVLSGAYALLFLWNATLREVLGAAARVATLVVGITIVVGILVTLLYFLATLFQSGGGGILGSSSTSSVDMPGAVDSPSSNLVTSIVLLGGAALAVLVLATIVSSRDGGGDSIPGIEKRTNSEREDLRDPLPGAVGEVTDPAATNDVYRVWRDLHDRAGDRRRADSPGDLRRRAQAAGYDEGAVGELTALFNAVRYGDDGVTAERERRARELETTLTDDEHRNR